MNTKKLASLVLVALLFVSASPAFAASAASKDSRYFVKSTSNIWKNSLGVHNSFEDGFTADLTDWQVRLTKIFGVEVESVGKFYVLPSEAAPSKESSPEASIKGRTVTRPVPSVQTPWGIKMIYGVTGSLIPSGGKDVTVAILDTGILKTHPDLARRVADCKDFTPTKGPVNGSCDDKNGHGTHVAGIIAADGGSDGLGIYGVAPEAKLFAYKVCSNNGSCWADDIAMGIRAAATGANRANIINMSLGSDTESPLIADAVAYARDNGVLVVAAAGNDGPNDGTIDYPGANPAVVAVGAVDSNRVVADWSSRGINTTTTQGVIEDKDLEVAAPGVNVESTWKDGGYIILSGTSMASPHIAGLAAKIWNTTPNHTAAEVRDALRSLAEHPAHEDNASGYGLTHLTVTP